MRLITADKEKESLQAKLAEAELQRDKALAVLEASNAASRRRGEERNELRKALGPRGKADCPLCGGAGGYNCVERREDGVLVQEGTWTMNDWIDCGEDCKCVKCGGATEYRLVEDDFGHEDVKHRCKVCGAIKWTDGIDS